ncbi:MAG: hypothetical protein KC492_38405 [Myxococcales bacterium]|nr:hypothetical protein [Myxococcales bacterium]
MINDALLDKWLSVDRSLTGSPVDAVKVVRLATGGFLLLTRENGEEFDVWVESAADLLRDLRSMGIEC